VIRAKAVPGISGREKNILLLPGIKPEFLSSANHRLLSVKVKPAHHQKQTQVTGCCFIAL
jgi:hypothetical protein